MPRIFDNLAPDSSLLPALRETLDLSSRADFCVGYFNLRGWGGLAPLVDRWQPGDGPCRVLIGMQRLPHQDLRDALSLVDRPSSVDNQTAHRLRVQLAEQLRQQLTIGAPTNADERTLRQLAAQLRAKKVVVKLFLRHPLHAKLYLLFRDDPINPIVGYLGSSNLTFAGLSGQGELNMDVLDHDAALKLKQWFEDRWNDRFCVDITDEMLQIIEESWAREVLIPPHHVYLKMAYHLSHEARAGLAEFRIPKVFGDRLFDFQAAAVKIAAHHLNKRNGVLIGDVVGLGKTLMATAVARIFEDDYGLETLVEFYGIMSGGGFDVVIGNPPYVESRSVSEYKVRGYKTESCGDLYAYALERAIELSHVDSWIGYIVPLSCFSVERFAPIQQLYLNEMSPLFISHWSGDAHPSKLFEGVDKRLQIVLARNHRSKGFAKLYSSSYLKWYADERVPLFSLSPTYQQIDSLAEVAFFASSVPKLCSDLEIQIIQKLRRCTRRVGSLVSRTGKHQLYYTRKVSFFLQFLDFVPEVRDDSGKSRAPSELKILNFNDEELRTLSLACLSTSLFYWYNTINSDCRNLNKREIVSFPVPSDVPPPTQRALHELLATLMQSYNDNSILRTVRYKTKGNITVQYFNFRPSKPIIDKIDRVLAEHYGFTEEELDFIINYDIKYRMGREG